MPGGWKRRAAAVVVALSVAAVPGAVTAAPSAQGTPESGDPQVRLQAISNAFGAVADRAAEGSWQRADAAYNEAVGALDEGRPLLEAALGPAAGEALGRAEARLGDLDLALVAEDAAEVRAVVSVIQAALAGLAPGIAVTAVPEEASRIVIAWRDALGPIAARGEAGQWIEMRNAAIALQEAIAAQSPQVARAAGPGGEPALRQARVFASRLFAASLDQSRSDAAVAAELYREAMDRLLVALGALPPPSPSPAPNTRTRFRAFQAEGRVGDAIIVPIIAEAIPPLGLGSYEIRLQWSPAALRWVEVTWGAGVGTVRRDDALGYADLTLPQAPSGPSGNPVLAQVRFQITGSTVDGRAYLPHDELAAIEQAARGGLDNVRRGNTPRAAADLARAYTQFARGRDRPGSLYLALARHGLAEPLADGLLGVLDLTSEPAETDEIVLALSDLGTRLEATLAAYLDQITLDVDIPITLEVLGATDTLGTPLRLLDPVPGGVVLPAQALDATAAPIADDDRTPTVLPARETVASAGDQRGRMGIVTGVPPSPPTTSPAAARPTDVTGAAFPLPVVAAIAAAFAVGAAAMWWTARQGPPASPGG